MTPTEPKLQRQLTEILEPMVRRQYDGVYIKHSSFTRSGVPDFTCTFLKLTSWTEVKHSKTLPGHPPRVKHESELQHIMCRRLAKAGNCWYVVYEGRDEIHRTAIVRPAAIDARGYYTEVIEARTGLNHHFVAEFIVRQHQMVASRCL